MTRVMPAWAGLVILLLAAFPVSAGAATPTRSDEVFDHPATPAQVLQLTTATSATLRDAAVIRGGFVQQRRLAGLPRPLVSTGDFVFARDEGILWRTQTPFASRFVLTRSGLVQQDEGADAVRLDTRSEPALRFVARVFLALFALDVEALAADFELHAMPLDGGWVLGLEPKSGALRAVFDRVTLQGSRDVDTVTLVDAHGDRTRIELRDVAHSRGSLSAAERQLFR